MNGNFNEDITIKIAYLSLLLGKTIAFKRLSTSCLRRVVSVYKELQSIMTELLKFWIIPKNTFNLKIISFTVFVD